MLIKSVIFFIVLYTSSWHVFGDHWDVKLEPFSLDEYLEGTFSDKGWNGTWVSDLEFIYTKNDSIYKINVTQIPIQPHLLVDSNVFNDYPQHSFTFSSNLKYILIKYNVTAIFRHSVTAQYTVYDVTQGQYYHVHDQKFLQYAVWAPTGEGLVYVFENNIYYAPNVNKIETPRQVTTDGVPGIIYNGVPDWVYEEEVLGSGFALWFSPDGNSLAFVSFNDTEVSDFHYIKYGESKDLYSTVVTLKYPKPGTTNPTIAIKYINLSNDESEVIPLLNMIPIDIVSKDHVLKDIKWVTNSEIVALSLNRVQNIAAIVKCNVLTDECNNVYTHTLTNGWIELQTPVYSKNGTKFLILLSEPEDSNSFKHLSLVENEDVSQRKRFTHGKRDVTSVYGWDEDNNLIYYSGTVEGDPAQEHVFCINLTKRTDRCITCDMPTPEGPCEVASASFSKDFSYYAKTCSGPGPKIVLIKHIESLDGFIWENNAKLRQQLLKKYIPIRKDLHVPLLSGYNAYVRLLLPPNLNYTHSSHPMIVDVYGGPNSNQISNVYSTGVENYFVTNCEYIYAFIDGRGSGKNGDNFMYEVYRKLGTIEMEDQIEVTKYLLTHYQFIDARNIGIWGWSYGGFATLSILTKDVENIFKFGLAVAPVTNFALYDSIYTERYMGLPTEEDNLEGYNRTDISQSVEALRNKTFYIIHGNADDNVHYQHSMILAKALQRADIVYLQQSYPDENHSIKSVSPHLYHLINKFFDHGFRIQRSGKKRKIRRRTVYRTRNHTL